MPRLIGWGKWIAKGCLLAITVLVTATPVAGQITPDLLIGSAVRGKGPHYLNLQQAIDAFNKRDYDKAMELLVDAKRATPKLAPPELMMAQMYMSTNQVLDGRIEFEKTIKAWPNDPEAYLALSELDFSERHLASARLLLQKALSLAENFHDNVARQNSLLVRIYAGIVTIEEYQESWPQARDIALKWVKLDPENATPHTRLARIYFKLERSDDAFKEFQKAKAADEQSTPAEVAMANLYYGANDRMKAQEWVKKAMDSGAKDSITLIAIAKLKFEANELDEAAKYALEAGRADPRSLNAKKLLGIIARMQRKYDAAKKYLEAAHVQSPSDLESINHLALVLVEMKDEKDRAIEFAELGYQSSRNSADAAATLGWVYYRLGRLHEASNYLVLATKNGVTSPDTAYYMAAIYSKQSRNSEALAILDRIVQAKGTFFYRLDAEALLKELQSKEQKKKGEDFGEPGGEKASGGVTPSANP
jgi:tetratricopeptide (TPR) repeat protein